MKNYNGGGCVFKLPGRRKNPWAVRFTVGYKMNKSGNFIQQYMYLKDGRGRGMYFSTRKEAEEARIKFLAQTPDVKKAAEENIHIDMTFEDVFAQWYARNFPDDEKSSRQVCYKTGFNKCQSLHKMRMTEIKLKHLQSVMDMHAGSSKSTLNNIKLTMNVVFSWAIKNDIIEKNYVQYVEYSCHKTEHHGTVDIKSVEALWNNPFQNDIAIMLFYTGCRKMELLSLQKEDVDLQNQCFYIKKSKTAAGIRTVPIADKILPLFKNRMAKKGKTVFPENPTAVCNAFKKQFGKTVHSTRATFISMLTIAGTDERIIQKIVGHSGGNITRDVYTTIDLKTMLKAVNSI